MSQRNNSRNYNNIAKIEISDTLMYNYENNEIKMFTGKQVDLRAGHNASPLFGGLLNRGFTVFRLSAYN